MRRTFALGLLPLVLGTCGPLHQSSRSRPAQVPAAPTTTWVDHREPLGHLQYPGIPGNCTSPWAPEISLPCGEVLGVCSGEPPQPSIMPGQYRCTPESATQREVCATRPVDEWPFYGLDPERCAQVG